MVKKKFLSILVAFFLLASLLTAQSFAQPGDPDPKVLLDPQLKTPLFIDENWTNKNIKNKRQLIWSYLTAKKALFRLQKNAQSHFRIIKEEKDNLGFTHFRLQQVLNGVKVYGGDSTIHVNKNNQITAYLGKFYPGLEQRQIPTKPSISKQQAINIAKKDLKLNSNPSFVKSDLWIYPYQNQYYLAYEVKISTIQSKPSYWHYYIDGTNGKIIRKYDAITHIKGNGKGVHGDNKTFEVTCKQRKRNCVLHDQTRGKGIKTHNGQNKDYRDPSLPGPIIKSATNTFNEPAGVDAHTYLAMGYDYFKKNHKRNSFDNNGSTIISSVHIGNKWNNAAWNGKQILFGDGNGEEFVSFAGGLDVAVHELTHGVTEYTAGLEYWGESGAINESMSDIFAVMVDPDWLIGEDTYRVRNENNAFRSMKDPKKFDQPDHYRDRYIGPQDNGGVHINSGINNKAAYLLMEGGTHYGVTVQKIGKPKTAKIYYRALTYYLTRTSNFSQMRKAAIKAAKDLYGNNSAEVSSVKNAYKSVGVK